MLKRRIRIFSADHLRSLLRVLTLTHFTLKGSKKTYSNFNNYTKILILNDIAQHFLQVLFAVAP